MWPFGKPKSRQPVRVRVVRARFDAATTTPDNARHWAGADSLSADAAANASVRRTLRNRARYEIANNSYARGIVLTLANDVIGTGPRLQMLLGEGLDDAGDQPTPNQIIEREFAAWAKAIDLPGKLRTMRQARAQDGEVSAVQSDCGRQASPLVTVRGRGGLHGCYDGGLHCLRQFRPGRQQSGQVRVGEGGSVTGSAKFRAKVLCGLPRSVYF